MYLTSQNDAFNVLFEVADNADAMTLPPSVGGGGRIVVGTVDVEGFGEMVEDSELNRVFFFFVIFLAFSL